MDRRSIPAVFARCGGRGAAAAVAAMVFATLAGLMAGCGGSAPQATGSGQSDAGSSTRQSLVAQASAGGENPAGAQGTSVADTAPGENVSAPTQAGVTRSASDGVMSWKLKGNGDFLVELYQVGAPYPSRQTYTGQITSEWNAAWSNLTRTQNYFIRVTNRRTGQTKQTKTIYLNPSTNQYWIGLDWGQNYLAYSWTGCTPG